MSSEALTQNKLHPSLLKFDPGSFSPRKWKNSPGSTEGMEGRMNDPRRWGRKKYIKNELKDRKWQRKMFLLCLSSYILVFILLESLWSPNPESSYVFRRIPSGHEDRVIFFFFFAGNKRSNIIRLNEENKRNQNPWKDRNIFLAILTYFIFISVFSPILHPVSDLILVEDPLEQSTWRLKSKIMVSQREQSWDLSAGWIFEYPARSDRSVFWGFSSTLLQFNRKFCPLLLLMNPVKRSVGKMKESHRKNSEKEWIPGWKVSTSSRLLWRQLIFHVVKEHHLGNKLGSEASQTNSRWHTINGDLYSPVVSILLLLLPRHVDISGCSISSASPSNDQHLWPSQHTVWFLS